MAEQDSAATTGPWEDYAAPPSAASAGDGPWNDYAKPDAQPVAGATGPLPTPAAHPAANMQPAPTIRDAAQAGAEDFIGNQPIVQIGKAAYGAGKNLVSGARDIYQGAKQDFAASGGNPLANGGKSSSPQALAQQRVGAAKVVAGGATAGLMLDAPALGEVVSSALAGNATAQLAFAKLAAGFVAGTGASAGAGMAADKLQMTPEAKQLMQTAAFFLPSVMGAAAAKATGLKTAAGTLEGNPAAGASAFGGKVRAGAVATPEAYDVRAQVGRTRFGVRVPRGGSQPQAPDPAQISAEATQSSATQAVAQAAELSKAAENAVNGKPPEPQGPPPPPDMASGALTPKTVQAMASVIQAAPPEMQPKMQLEAHQNLAKWMLKSQRFVGPDGKLQIVDSPDKAAALAQQVINDEVDRQTKAAEDQRTQQEDAAKEQQKQVEQRQKDAEKQAAQQKKAAEATNENGLTPAEVQYQRAKTLIESSSSPAQASANIMRSLNVTRDQAQALMARHQLEQVPDVGSNAEPTKEESRATVDAQVAALARGEIPVVMLPEGSKYRPAVPAGMKVMGVQGKVPGAGLYLYDPAKVNAKTIREAAKAGTHGDLLGHVQAKTDLADGQPTVVVQAHTPEGTPVQDSQVHANPELVQKQAEILAERHPQAQISVKSPEQVLMERAHAAKGEGDAIQEQSAGEVGTHPGGDQGLGREEQRAGVGTDDSAVEASGARSAEEDVTQANLERKGGRGESPEQAAEGGMGTPSAAVTPVAKGDRVAFTDRNGVEREGTIAFKGERMARIKDDRGKSYDNVPAASIGEPRPPLQPGGIGRVATSELHLDPKRFQYKVNVGTDGVNDLLKGKKWNDDLAGVVSVWRDPQDGKMYVVNGHHRADLAKKTGAQSMAVRMLRAQTPEEARAIGALQNIAEGRGTALDAAKFIRDSGITLEDLNAKGISMGEATAQNGVALSRLDGRLFDQVVQGKMSPGRGIAIGRETADPATQEAIVALIEKRGGRIDDGTVGELARFAATAPQRQETVASLFGDQEQTHSTALEKAEVSSFVKRQLSAEKRVFGAVATEGKAKTLEATGNKINAADNAERATNAEHALAVYDKLSARRGAIDDILNRAAGELADARPAQQPAIKQRAYDDIRAAVSDALSGKQGTGVARDEDAADRPPDRAEIEDAGQHNVLAGAVEPKPPTLPGMEEAVEQQAESAEALKSDTQREAVEQSLRSAKPSIDKATGDMERNSPLFHGSDASGQDSLFDDRGKDVSYLGGTLGISPDALKPLAEIKPVADVLAFLGDEADRIAVSRDLHNRLYDLASQNDAAALRVVQMLESLPGTAEDQEAIYYHLEDPKANPLTPEQEDILDNYLTPLIYQAEQDFQVVTEGGVPLENYVHRQVRDKGGMIDRLLERAKEKKTSRSNVPSGRLTKTAPAAKHRTMMAIERVSPENGRPGERQVVAIKGGRVLRVQKGKAPEDLGSVVGGSTTLGKQVDEAMLPFVRKVTELRAELAATKGQKTLDGIPRGTKVSRLEEALKDAEAARDYFLDQYPTEHLMDRVWKDKRGDLWKITQATTKEIEANTDLRYYHNAAGSVAVNYLAMSNARRAFDFLNEFKASPEFAQYSHSLQSPGAIPKGWKTTQLPQFRGYFFEPHIAEVLDMYAKRTGHDPGVFDKVNQFLRTSIFFNPLIHIPNLLNHWVVEKGISTFANPMNYPRMTRAGMKAINAVIHQNQDFLDALDAGAPLQSQQFETKQLADVFFNKMQEELGDPESSKAKELASALGMAPARLVKAIYTLSSKATWFTNDIAFLQATYEKQARGMALKDALKETAKHIPDYRYMTRIFNSAKLGSLMSNPNITMFGAYHYGALKSYGQMMKSVAGFNWQDAGTKDERGEPTNAAGRTEAEEKLHGLDVLAMAGLITFVVYPLIDHLLRTISGNDKAQLRRPGASTLPYNLAMLAKGEKTPTELAESIATPAPALTLGAELAFNRDMRTGQRIYNSHAAWETVGGQVVKRGAEAIAPVSQGIQVAEGRTDAKRLLYSLVGVSFPLHGAEKIAAQITAERLASLPPRDEKQIAHSVERSRALHDYWSGDPKRLNQLLAGKDFTPTEKLSIRKAKLLPPLIYAVKPMAYDDALRVYKAATAEQKAQLRPLLNQKLARLVAEGKKPTGAAFLSGEEE